MAAQGQINLEMLIRIAADQAKRELQTITASAQGLTTAARELDTASASTGAKLTGAGAAATSAAAPINVLASNVARADVDFTSWLATVGRSGAALAGATNAVTGLTTNLSAQTLEMVEAQREGAAWQAMMDSIRASYNPLFAASRQYEQELRNIADAERMGAISATEASAARDRAAQALAPINEGLRQQVQSAGAARAANANLIAQGNDIMMMIAAGQSPMMLALQQGTQVSQVLNQVGSSGASVLRTLGTSLIGLVSPMNIATIGIIGFGAAGIQALVGLLPHTKSLQERMAALTDAFAEYKAISEVAGSSTADLSRQFGEGAAAAQGLYAVLAGLSKLALDEQLKKTGNAARELIGMDVGDQFLVRDARNASDFFGLGSGASQVRRHSADISSFDDALKGFETANGIEAQTAAMQTLLERVEYMATLKGGISDQEQALIDLLKQQADVLLGIQGVETARKQRTANEANAITRELTQQVELSRTMAIHGENSAQVEALRTAHAREALQLRLQEAGVTKGSADETRALAEFDAARLADQALRDQERRKAAGEIIGDLQQQLALSDATARYGEDSAQVEALRAGHARDALKAKLEELNVAPGLLEFALKLLDADQQRVRAAKEAQSARQVSDMLAELQNEAAINQAILTHGRDSLQVKELQIAAERRAYAQQVEAMEISRQQKDMLMAQWEAARGLAGVDPYGTRAAGQQLLKDQSTRLAQLQLELGLAGQTEEVRTRVLALHQTEQEIRDRGISATSDLAAQLRAGALEEAALEARLDRITSAWGRVDDAAGSAIDNMVDGLTGGGKDALRSAAQDMLGLIQQLTLNNPLKNMILGSNLPTMSDVGGIGGIIGRFAGRKDPVTGLAVSSMNPSSMAVTTPMVSINAGAIAGAIPSFTAGMPTADGKSIPTGLAAAIAPGALLPGGTDVQSQIWSFFQGKGLAPHQIAGIMGNVAAESAFDPLAQGDHIGGVPKAFGLFQWNNRRGQLFDFIGGQENLGNIQAQLEFAWKELMTSENGAFRKLQASTNVYDATHAFAGFERPSGYNASTPQSAHGWDRRLAGAEAALAKFESTSVSAQTQLGTLGTGAQTLGTGMQQMTANLAGTLQGIGASYGPGGAFIGGLLGEGLKLLTGGGAAAKPAGYRDGGYTGAGAPDDVAGVVHAGEYVFDAAATRRLGVANLEALRSGHLPGYRDGGYVVGGVPPVSGRSGQGSAGTAMVAEQQKMEVHITVSGTGNSEIRDATAMGMQEAFERFERDVMPGRVRKIIDDRWGE